MAETYFTRLMFVLSVLWYGSSCFPSGSQNEIQADSAVMIPGLREQLIEDSNSGNFSRSLELAKEHLDNTTLAYEQVNNIIQMGYNVGVAVWEGYVELIQIALDNGLPINKRYGNEECTMLHGAVCSGQYKLVSFLIQKGAEVNVRNHYGDSPLHLAALNGYVNIVQLLVERGADINSTNNIGNTPLHIAAKYGHESLVQWLVSNGCDTTIRNNDGKTALDLANTQKIRDIIRNDKQA